jgi:Xaa-Pro aminopeptidase
MNSLKLQPDVYFERIGRMQKKVAEAGLDAIIIVSSEAEPANVRYFTNYWPVFETAGILIPAQGKPLLLTGPESIKLVDTHSVLTDYRKLLELRESSDPEYPDIEHSTFEDVFDEISFGKGVKKIGLIGTNIMTVQVYEGIVNACKGAEIVKCDNFLREMRMIKTPEELDLMRRAAAIAQKGFEYALLKVQPGMTEIEAAAECMYGVLSNGAETPGFMIWCVSGPHTNQAIGKSTFRKIEKNEIVQFTMGAMCEGYVSSFGRPFCFGKPSDKQFEVLKTGLESNKLTHSLVKAGSDAASIAKTVQNFIKVKGLGDHIVYGPCHGIGMMECEFPFIESISDYKLKENMTFAVDTFLAGPDYGMRYEDTVVVTKDGEEQFAPNFRDIIIL